MNFWIDGARDDLEKVIKRVDILSINDGEAKMLSGKNNLVDAAAEIRAMGPDMLVIKRGEHGALAFYNDEMFSVPAYPLKEVVDPTGAGDSFAGGLMGYLTRHGKLDAQSFRQAILMGSVMASYNVQDFSLGRLAELSPSLIRERIRDFSRLIHVNIDGIDVDYKTVRFSWKLFVMNEASCSLYSAEAESCRGSTPLPGGHLSSGKSLLL